jgi:hypothetical protein
MDDGQEKMKPTWSSRIDVIQEEIKEQLQACIEKSKARRETDQEPRGGLREVSL